MINHRKHFAHNKTRQSAARSLLTSLLIPALSFAVVFGSSNTISLAETAKDKKDPKAKETAANNSGESSSASNNTTFTCESNIYYTWKRLPPPDNAGTSSKEKGGKKEKKEKPEVIQPDEAFFMKITDTAPTQGEAEFTLRGKFAHAQSAARQECERLHQSLSGCLVNSMRTAKEDYQVFDFELRRKYIEAMQQDCILETGVCISTRAGEISCHEDLKPTEKSNSAGIGDKATENGNTKEAGKKDPGKDAKKK